VVLKCARFSLCSGIAKSRNKEESVRATKLVRKLIGIASFFVMGFYFEEFCLVVKVRPSWLKPRCSGCGKIRPGYDRRSNAVRWVHLSIGSIRIILEYAPRRTECPTCGVLVEKLPWARAGCRFTRPFEELTAYLAQITNKTEVTKIMGISWYTVGNIIKRVVNDKLDDTRLDGLRCIGVDEFSYRKGHRYITVVVDHATRRVVWSREGKSSDTLNTFFDELGEERTKKIETITADMSAAYTKSIKAKAPHAKIIYDLFHVIKLASEAVDAVRRAMVNEYKNDDQTEEAAATKKSRYVLLKSQWNLRP
jgi:transposase